MLGEGLALGVEDASGQLLEFQLELLATLAQQLLLRLEVLFLLLQGGPERRVFFGQARMAFLHLGMQLLLAVLALAHLGELLLDALQLGAGGLGQGVLFGGLQLGLAGLLAQLGFQLAIGLQLALQGGGAFALGAQLHHLATVGQLGALQVVAQHVVALGGAVELLLQIALAPGQPDGRTRPAGQQQQGKHKGNERQGSHGALIADGSPHLRQARGERPAFICTFTQCFANPGPGR